MQASAFAPNTNRRSVTLVDEDLVVRRSLQLLLGSANYEVRAYATAKALIADPGALGSACLITDWDVPTFDGLELLRHVRGQGWNAPAILMTSLKRPGLELLATDAGFQALLIKPLIDRVVLETVRSAIDRGVTAQPRSPPSDRAKSATAGRLGAGSIEYAMPWSRRTASPPMGTVG